MTILNKLRAWFLDLIQAQEFVSVEISGVWIAESPPEPFIHVSGGNVFIKDCVMMTHDHYRELSDNQRKDEAK
jgi:hypothetical protein